MTPASVPLLFLALLQDPAPADTGRAERRPPQRIGAVVIRRDAGDDAPPSVGRLQVARTAADARAAGMTTVGAALASLPFVTTRSGRGDLALSLRGSRPEQVLVRLDGVPLNDPATGMADVGDIPLAALSAVTSTPGAAAREGSGAVGGTVDLHTGRRAVLSAGGGAWGRLALEGAYPIVARDSVSGRSLTVGGALSRAENDFPFRNVDAASGEDSVERRVNADERRAALFAHAAFSRRWHLTALGSTASRGMAGPMNVRANDADRGETRRAFARLAGAVGPIAVGLGARGLALEYRDPSRPAFDVDSRVTSVDVDARSVLPGALVVRAGAGGDALRATRIASSTRTRGWAAVERAFVRGAWVAQAVGRVDAIEGARGHPSASLAVERAGAVAPFARVGQAFRAPTLYDIHLAAPQRLQVATLLPERVVLDAEAGARAAFGEASLAASVFHRRTRDAIVWFPGNFGWSPGNVGEERAMGAEARASLASRGASLEGWGAFTDAALDVGGPTLATPYVPRWSGGAIAAASSGPLRLTAAARALGARPWTAAPRSPAVELPAVGLLDLTFAWTVSRRSGTALVTAGVTNVTDERWESVRRFPTPGRGWAIGITFLP